MTTAIAAAEESAFAATLALRSEEVTYSTSTGNVTLRAVRGVTNWGTEQSDRGAQEQTKSADWLFRAADCAVDNETQTPSRGHYITDAAGIRYQVMPFGPDDLLWRWHDRTARTVRRVHTKERT